MGVSRLTGKYSERKLKRDAGHRVGVPEVRVQRLGGKGGDLGN